jgi:hypothetical protein
MEKTVPFSLEGMNLSVWVGLWYMAMNCLVRRPSCPRPSFIDVYVHVSSFPIRMRPLEDDLRALVHVNTGADD